MSESTLVEIEEGLRKQGIEAKASFVTNGHLGDVIVVLVDSPNVFQAGSMIGRMKINWPVSIRRT